MNTEDNSQGAQVNPSFGEKPNLLWGAATDIGRVRDENQDSFVGLPEIGLFLVSDGIGGAQGGKLVKDFVDRVRPKLLEIATIRKLFELLVY